MAYCYGSEKSATDARATTHPAPIAHLTSQEAQDLVSLSSSSYLPYTLRLKHEKEEIGSENVDLTENVIMNMGKLKEMINLVHGNSCKNPWVNVDIVDCTCLCLSVSIKCSACHFCQQPLQLSDTVNKSCKLSQDTPVLPQVVTIHKIS